MARRETVLLALVLAAGAALRLYGLNWDGGHWLHPDERQIYFTVVDLGWPVSLAEALSPESPLNPGFFAYGSLPIYLLKLVSLLLSPLGPALRDPDNLHLIGRPLAALFDVGTVYLTYRLAKRVLGIGYGVLGKREESEHRTGPVQDGRGAALLAAALASLAVVHVQLAHFYTVDPLLTFWVMLTLNLAADVAQGDGRGHQIGLGLTLGLALATKVSAAPLALTVVAAYSIRFTSPAPRPRQSLAAARPVLGAFALALAVFFLTQPYALVDWQTFVDDTLRESQIAWGRLDAPYTLQYAGTLPFLYSMWQTALWGLALPVGMLAWAGLATALVRWLRRGPWTDTLLLAWAGAYFAIGGLLYARYLRYMLPLVPVLLILAVQLLKDIRPPSSVLRRRVFRVSYGLLGILSLAYVVAFVGIYASPHSWIAASEWIYREVPAGRTLAVEDWDVALPLPLTVDGEARRIEEYDVRVLPLYDEPDGAAKWEVAAGDLADSDYLVIASRRLYGSIPRLPERYPLASRYYALLLDGELGFALAGEFSRGPAWLNPRVAPLPDAAPVWLVPDESFVVYDHPRALVFRNVDHLPAEELLRRLGVGE